jgi:hypothetical protein
MEATVMQRLIWPNLRKDAEAIVKTCPQYQKGGGIRKKCGQPSEKVAEKPIPWGGCRLYRSFNQNTHIGKDKLLAMKMIVPTTGGSDVDDLKHKVDEEAMLAFDDVWLSVIKVPTT